MYNLLEFAERLRELMIEKDINQAQLATILNVKEPTVSRYLTGKNIPKLEVFVCIADYFNCYIDFLAGKSDIVSKKDVIFKKCPPFPTRFKFLLENYEISRYKLQQKTGISKSIMRYWEIGRTNPTIDNLIKIADKLDCSLDFILGRVDYD